MNKTRHPVTPGAHAPGMPLPPGHPDNQCFQSYNSQELQPLPIVDNHRDDRAFETQWMSPMWNPSQSQDSCVPQWNPSQLQDSSEAQWNSSQLQDLEYNDTYDEGGDNDDEGQSYQNSYEGEKSEKNGEEEQQDLQYNDTCDEGGYNDNEAQSYQDSYEGEESEENCEGEEQEESDCEESEENDNESDKSDDNYESQDNDSDGHYDN